MVGTANDELPHLRLGPRCVVAAAPEPRGLMSREDAPEYMQSGSVQADQKHFLVGELIARGVQSVDVQEQLREKQLELSFQG